MLEPQSGALHDQLGPELGAVFAELHRAHGVEFRFGETAVEFRPGMVITSGGAEIPADVLVVGIGAAPNDDLAAQAGLETGNGVLTDEALRTSDPDIFAAGDVANSFNPLLGRRVRVEHWANALNGGPAAARSMLGQPVRYDQVPYFYSDQYDLGMECAGLPSPGTLRPGPLPRRPRHPGVHRVLALQRRRDRRHERQRVGRQRRHPGPDPRRPPSRPRPPHQPRHPPNRPLSRSTLCGPPCVLRGLRCSSQSSAARRPQKRHPRSALTRANERGGVPPSTLPTSAPRLPVALRGGSGLVVESRGTMVHRIFPIAGSTPLIARRS